MGVNDLAGKTGFSVGLAHHLLARLETERVMAAKGHGPQEDVARTVADPEAPLDLRAEEAGDRGSSRQPVCVLA